MNIRILQLYLAKVISIWCLTNNNLECENEVFGC